MLVPKKEFPWLSHRNGRFGSLFDVPRSLLVSLKLGVVGTGQLAGVAVKSSCEEVNRERVTYRPIVVKASNPTINLERWSVEQPAPKHGIESRAVKRLAL